MAKRIDYAIELLEKCKDMFANIVASGEYCDNDKEDYRKSVEALKWARRQRDNASHNSLHKHDVMQAKGDPNCKLCHGEGYYSFSTFDGGTTTTKRCGCLQFGA